MYFKNKAAKKSKSGETVRFVSIAFYEGGKEYDYICEDEGILPGDMVKINTHEGIKDLKVLHVFEKNIDELAMPVEKYKKIVTGITL